MVKSSVEDCGRCGSMNNEADRFFCENFEILENGDGFLQDRQSMILRGSSYQK